MEMHDDRESNNSIPNQKPYSFYVIVKKRLKTD